MRDVYAPTHWAIVGTPPAYDTPDEDVYLIGRNLVLLTKAGVVAATHKASRLVLGPLAGNPFPDATPEFFAAMQRALTLGLNHDLTIETPFVRMHKDDVIRLGDRLGVPMALTLSCMNPVDAADAAALRAVQQVPRAPRRLRRRRHSRPDRIRVAEAAVTARATTVFGAGHGEPDRVASASRSPGCCHRLRSEALARRIDSTAPSSRWRRRS